LLPALRTEFLQSLCLTADDLYVGGPLLPLDVPPDPWPMMTSGGTWLNVNLWKAYFSADYRRGDPRLFALCGEWLETRIPDAGIFYGNDTDDRSLRPFGKPERMALLSLLK